ncbi:MAG TPA: DUF1566 domain-containing protein, partial [Thiolinea sp.]|nr:DUF1566 domain-containing protein [Thiolinea sp.]
MNDKLLLSTCSVLLISLSLTACNNNPPAATSSTSTAQTPSQNSSRYHDNGDGTVTDSTTKLMWKKCLEGRSGANCQLGNANTSAFLWNETPALTKASFANHNDWRLPSLQELNSLVKCGNGKPSNFKAEVTSCWGPDRKGTYTSPTIDTQAFPNV